LTFRVCERRDTLFEADPWHNSSTDGSIGKPATEIGEAPTGAPHSLPADLTTVQWVEKLAKLAGLNLDEEESDSHFLGLSSIWTKEELKHSVHKIMQVLHPDRLRDVPQGVRGTLQDIASRVTAAHKCLGIRGPPANVKDGVQVAAYQEVEEEFLVMLRAKVIDPTRLCKVVVLTQLSEERSKGWIAEPMNTTRDTLSQWYCGQLTLKDMFLQTHASHIVVVMPPGKVGEQWKQGLAMDFKKLSEQNFDVHLHMLLLYPAYSGHPWVFRNFQYMWALGYEPLSQFLEKEVWFEGLVDCLIAGSNSRNFRPQRVGVLTFGSKAQGAQPPMLLNSSKFAVQSELGLVLVLDVGGDDANLFYAEV
jgi:hypothetical protein